MARVLSPANVALSPRLYRVIYKSTDRHTIRRRARRMDRLKAHADYFQSLIIVMECWLFWSIMLLGKVFVLDGWCIL